MDKEKRIQISGWQDFTGRVVSGFPGLLARLAQIETRALDEHLSKIAIEKPVYVTGLARSGSTILLEILSRHPDLGSHRYRDFPALEIPYFWNWFVDRASSPAAEPEERAHKDGILVSPESPEAMEEMIWMRFFPDNHDPGVSQVLTESCDRPDFESFYRNHIRKLLLIRDRMRYLSKANYHVTRLRYLQKLFPDARFVIPVREPVTHIASLMKQHKLFSREEERDPRILEHMKRAGHFEFGINRTAINLGSNKATAEIEALWRDDEIRGWARYWASVYRYIVESIQSDHRLAEAAIILRYEDLCEKPRDTLARLFAHCEMKITPDMLTDLAAIPHFPSYYEPEFSPDDLTCIDAETKDTRLLIGYSN